MPVIQTGKKTNFARESMYLQATSYDFDAPLDEYGLTTTKSNLKSLHNAVIQFQLDTGQYPSEDRGLEDLIFQPGDMLGWDPSGYLETTELPKDAWGFDFIFERYPESGKPFVVISNGSDGEPGGEDYDADLYSTDAN